MAQKALVSVDHHFEVTPDGQVWVENIHDGLFWQRYLEVFDEIGVLCRMRKVDKTEKKAQLLSSFKNVTFLPVTDFRGPKTLAKQYFQIRKDIRIAFDTYRPDCVIARLPSTVGAMAGKLALRQGLPLAVEVVADPMHAYAHSGIVGKLAGKIYTRTLKKMCRKANGTSYVTRETLQKSYPAGGFTTDYSSVDLTDDFYYERSQEDVKLNTILHISNIHSPLKGLDTFLKALAKVRSQSEDICAVVVGEGSMRKHYESLAQQLGVGQAVHFTGAIADKSMLRQVMMDADALVLPTQAEGLPRVILECMATSLPCISTPVGGVPELLPPEMMLSPFDVDGFAEKLLQLKKQPSMLREQMQRNYAIALGYKRSVLQEKRNGFYRQLSQCNKPIHKEDPHD